jgi:hypothetical protein
MTELRVMAPLANGRATPESWTARLKLTAGALGIVDVYGPDGTWRQRTTWSPTAGFDRRHTSNSLLAALSTVLFTAFEALVTRNQRSGRKRRAA